MWFCKFCHAFFVSYFPGCFCGNNSKKRHFLLSPIGQKPQNEQISSRIVFSILAPGNEKKSDKKRVFLCFFSSFFRFRPYIGWVRTFGTPFKLTLLRYMFHPTILNFIFFVLQYQKRTHGKKQKRLHCEHTSLQPSTILHFEVPTFVPTEFSFLRPTFIPK